MKSSGYNSCEALKAVAAQQNERPGPYILIGCGDIADRKKIKMRPKPEDAPLHENLFQAYAEFRTIFSDGRYFMILGAKFDPEESVPKNAIFLDTQLVEKAMTSKDYKPA